MDIWTTRYIKFLAQVSTPQPQKSIRFIVQIRSKTIWFKGAIRERGGQHVSTFGSHNQTSYEKRKLIILWEIHGHDATGRTKHHVFCTSTCNRSNVYINGAAIKLVCYTSGHIHPEQKSDMILAIHSDASCLYEPKALSQACANFLSTNKGIS